VSADPHGADEAVLVVDALGARCPLPVIDLARRITDVEPGQVVALLADDEAARLDVPAWCEMRGHDYLGEPVAGTYLVRRRGSPVAR
jgi:TusA-related sulfurtransferase